MIMTERETSRDLRILVWDGPRGYSQHVSTHLGIELDAVNHHCSLGYNQIPSPKRSIVCRGLGSKTGRRVGAIGEIGPEEILGYR